MCMHVLILLYNSFIRNSRKTFDTTETRRDFGPVEVDYRTVQQKITDKYDSWHKQILGKFGNMLAGSQEDFYSTVSKVGVKLCSTEQCHYDAYRTVLNWRIIRSTLAAHQKW